MAFAGVAGSSPAASGSGSAAPLGMLGREASSSILQHVELQGRRGGLS
jgi:hypothetical protein